MTTPNIHLERIGIGFVLCAAMATFFSPLVSIYGPFTGNQSIAGYEVHDRLIRLQSTLGNAPAQGASQEHRVSSSQGGGVAVHQAEEAPRSLRMAWLAPLLVLISLACAAVAFVDLFFTRKLTGALAFVGGCFGVFAIVDVMVMNASLRSWLAVFTSNDSFGSRSNPFVAMRALMMNSIQMTPGPGLYALTGCLFVAGVLSYTNAIPRASLVVRRSSRAKFSQTVRIRPADPRNPEELCATLNVSQGGMYFQAAANHYYPGMEVLVTRNPDDGKQREEHASVVRVDQLEIGKVGVAVRIFPII